MKTQIRGRSQIIAASITDAEIAASAGIQTSKLADGASFFWRDGVVIIPIEPVPDPEPVIEP